MLITLLLMTVITFSSRFLFLSKLIRFEIGGKLNRFLSFSAPCVLTAIWLPIVVMPHGEPWLSWQNPYLLAAVAACWLAYRYKNLYLTTGVSLLLFFTLKAVLN